MSESIGTGGTLASRSSDAAGGLTKLLVIVLSLVFAGLAFASALGQSTRIWGALPLRNLYPLGGIAAVDEVERAYSLLTVGGAFDFPLPTDPRFGALAAYGLQHEPVSIDALRISAFSESGSGYEPKARAMLRAAEHIKKRDRLTNFWLVQDSIKRNDVAGVLRRLDRILRASGDSSGSILALMTQLMADRRSLPLLLEMLRAGPPWADQFWYYVARDRIGLANAAELRRSLAGTAMVVSPTNDARLIHALVESGEIDQAAALYQVLTDKSVARGSSTFSFDEAPELPPFDWVLSSSSDIAVRVDPKRSMLDVLATSDRDAMVARRLIALAPGPYRLSLNAVAGGEIGTMTMNIECIGHGEIAASAVEAGRQSWSGRVAVPSDCKWAWLQLVAGRAADGYSASIGEIRIAAAGEDRR